MKKDKIKIRLKKELCKMCHKKKCLKFHECSGKSKRSLDISNRRMNKKKRVDKHRKKKGGVKP